MIDVLLSIPILSYIFFPTTGASVSTSVNLVFFYMTWSSLVFSHHPLEIHLSGIVVLRVIFWLIPSLVFLLFDVGVPSLAVGFKHGGRSALPGRDFRKLGKTLGLAIANVFMMLVVEGAISMVYTSVFKKHIFKMSTTLPMPWIVFKHCSFIFTSREVLQYYIHRHVLHGNTKVAKQHMAYAHSRSGAPYSVCLYADHIVPLMLHRFVPVFLPSVLIRTHMLTYFFVLIIVSIEETLSMSGYTFIPGIVMSGITQRTAIHYAGKGSSNYGPLGIMDWGHGTSRGRDVLEDLKKEADKHNVEEKSAKKVDQASSAMKNGVDSLKRRVRTVKE
ncbi:Sterol desaturase family [Moelleriella libera RCEF 2490]|uniref:Sterol desaturase family n=1 Tax=Moelleriella libera RCEF 2490 TaxID=1081109 RepID=A0A168DFY4_9HYPO|nr:Sterol desaturase family [Moelleriella libera RCEF 2490]